MKKLKYLTVPLAVIFNTMLVFLIVGTGIFIHSRFGGLMPLSLYIPFVIVAVVIGVALAILAIKTFVGGFEGLKRKGFWIAISSFAVAVVGSCCAVFSYQHLFLFLLTVAIFLAALYVFIGVLYTIVSSWLKNNDRIGNGLSASVGVALCLVSPFVFVSCINLINQTIESWVMGYYSASIAVSALLFIFGVALLIGAFVKGPRFSWIRPAAAMLLVVVICFSVLTFFTTGLTSGTNNFIKNAAIDIGMVRLGLTEKDYVCAYEGGDGERIYLLKTGRTDSDAELSELLECTKLGDIYHRTVNGVEYKHICLDYFGGYYIFTVIPA